jgi:hypothetical protein
MNRPDKLFLYLALCMLQLGLYGQDVKMAVKDYYINEHVNLEAEHIANNKISMLEKHQYTVTDDTVSSDNLIEKYLFNENGYPEYAYYKPVGFDKGEIFFSYDTIGNLVKKEIYGISPSLQYKLIEWYEWSYTNGFLTKEKRYLLTDKVSTKKGAYGFPEKFFLFSCDTILYSHSDTSCLVITNNPEHCKTDAYRLYPPNFQFVVNTVLTFHPNNNLSTKTVTRDTHVQKSVYDQCGNPITATKPNSRCIERMADSTSCLSQEKIRICNESDTVTIDNEKVYVVSTESSFFQHDSGAGTMITTKVRAYYDLDYQIISSSATTIYQPGEMLGELLSGGQEVIRESTYAYFNSGLLEKMVTSNEKGETVEVIAVEVEYYD